VLGKRLRCNMHKLFEDCSYLTVRRAHQNRMLPFTNYRAKEYICDRKPRFILLQIVRLFWH
jgi:hypothetical protein